MAEPSRKLQAMNNILKDDLLLRNSLKSFLEITFYLHPVQKEPGEAKLRNRVCRGAKRRPFQPIDPVPIL
jgi:hypothetical protein